MQAGTHLRRARAPPHLASPVEDEQGGREGMLVRKVTGCDGGAPLGRRVCRQDAVD